MDMPFLAHAVDPIIELYASTILGAVFFLHLGGYVRSIDRVMSHSCV